MRCVFRFATLFALMFGLVLPMAADDKKDTQEKLTSIGKYDYKLLQVKAGESITVQAPGGQVTYQFAQDVKVRWLNPPNTFDEKGNIKKHTAKELKELKGPDTKLPGYTAGVEDLKSNQIVTVYLGKKKGVNKPFATMIVILK